MTSLSSAWKTSLSLLFFPDKLQQQITNICPSGYCTIQIQNKILDRSWIDCNVSPINDNFLPIHVTACSGCQVRRSSCHLLDAVRVGMMINVSPFAGTLSPSCSFHRHRLYQFVNILGVHHFRLIHAGSYCVDTDRKALESNFR